MATSPNFSWPEPDNTDLVKNGALAIRTAVNAIDSSLAELKGGTTGQVLSKTTNTDMDFTWVTTDDANAIQNSIVDAKGDLISATANDTPARLAVGSNGSILTADSAQSTGLKYGGLWDTYTPTLTAESGTITTISGSARYCQIAKNAFVSYTITITNKGTGAGFLNMTLPVASKTATAVWGNGFGRETAVTGKYIVNEVTSGAGLGMKFVDGTTVIQSGYTLQGSFWYEVA